jgi:hypothetical protein
MAFKEGQKLEIVHVSAPCWSVEDGQHIDWPTHLTVLDEDGNEHELAVRFE